MIPKFYEFLISTSVTGLQLGLEVPNSTTHYSPAVKDTILNAISTYQNLPSIKTIFKNFKNQIFLKTATLDTAENELKRPNLIEASRASDIHQSIKIRGTKKETIGLSVFYPIYQKYLKIYLTMKL